MSDNYEVPFQFDEGVYTQLPNEEKMIPHELVLRAKAAVAEFKSIKDEYALHQRNWYEMKEKREQAFNDAMSHYQETKDEFRRVALPNGQVIWLDMTRLLSSIGNEPMPAIRMDYDPTGKRLVTKDEAFWPFGDTAEFY